MTPPEELLRALEALAVAHGALDVASGGVGPLAHGAALEIRVEIQWVIRRLQNLALFSGASPDRVEEVTLPATQDLPTMTMG